MREELVDLKKLLPLSPRDPAINGDRANKNRNEA